MPLTDEERDRIWELVEAYAFKMQELGSAEGRGVMSHYWTDEDEQEKQALRRNLRAALGFDDDGEGEKR